MKIDPREVVIQQSERIDPAEVTITPQQPKQPLTPTANSYRLGGTDMPGTVEQFLGGAKHTWDKAAMGLKGLVTDLTPEDRQLLEQGKSFVKETGPASTVGEIAPYFAIPTGGALQAVAPAVAARSATLFPKAFQFMHGTTLAPKAARVADTVATQAGIGAALDPTNRGEGAALGAVGGAVGTVLPSAVRAGRQALSHVAGLTTGAGGQAVEQAFDAGLRNGPMAKTFRANMTGKVEPSAVVEQARTALGSMRSQMHDAYATAKGGWAGDTTRLDFTPVEQALSDATKKFSFQGKAQPGAAEVMPKVQALIDDWKQSAAADPRFLTVEGLDALKRHLQDLMPSYENRTGQAFVSNVVDSVKSGIIKQRPDYADAMKAYWQAANEIDEISRSLSLGDSATVDTALRKLQSLMRNNANANYGQRLAAAQPLFAKDEAILPALAGQSLSSWTPRSLQGAVAVPSSIGVGTFVSPLAGALTAAASSPRIVGETAYHLGRGSRILPSDENVRRLTVNALRSRSGKGEDKK